VRFTVFANQPGGIAAEIHGRAKELFKPPAVVDSLGVKLALRKPPQEAAAGFAIRPRLGVEPVE
jgi:hypothetical protein